MLSVSYHILFTLFTIYILIESISYSIHEIKKESNKSGGICVTLFTIFCIVLGNIVAWTS